jgi:hypothetical protein
MECFTTRGISGGEDTGKRQLNRPQMITVRVVDAQTQGDCFYWHIHFLVYADAAADYILVVSRLKIARPDPGHATELPPSSSKPASMKFSVQ